MTSLPADGVSHTPGPWRVEPVGRAAFRAPNEDGANDLCIIAENGLCPGIVWEYLKEGEANARLIAASPDLLALCKEMREWLRPEIREEPGRSFFWKLVDVINKAEGKKSTYGDSVMQRLPPENVRAP